MPRRSRGSHRARESLCAHHNISLTNAVSLRNVSATRNLVRRVAFFITGRKQKFPHEALCEVWLFLLLHNSKISQTKCGFYSHKKSGMCRISYTYIIFIILNKTMDYTPWFLCEFQNVTVVHQPCLFHQLCQFFVPQIPCFHDVPTLNLNVHIRSSIHQNVE